ncbi:MAG: hypothetical protein HYU66_11620 [Armatimonadetes bacterium]|nr:hypothetical protein [Armatimonadota bacterium]
MLRGEAESYPQPVHLPKGWQGSAFVVFWGIGFGSAILMVPVLGILFGVIGWGAAAFAIRSLAKQFGTPRRGLRLTPTALTECFWFRRPRVTPLSAVTGGTIGDRHAVIHATTGDVKLDDSLPGWLRLANKVEAMHAGEVPEPEGRLVENEEIATWLGLTEGGWFRVGHGRAPIVAALLLVPVWLVVTGALTAFYGAFFIGLAKAPGMMKVGGLMFTLAHAAIFFGVFSGGLLTQILALLRRGLRSGIEVDVTGLTLGGRHGRHIAWGEIHSLTSDGPEWRLHTNDETVVFQRTDRNASRLAEAVQRAVTARENGLRLPELGPVPAGAISLVRQSRMEDSAERGLSLVDDAPPRS